MPINNRSQRQIQSLQRMREWHLNQAVKAKLDGKREEADFHYRYYDLLGPAVEVPSTASHAR
jgi:hypothetical protein